MIENGAALVSYQIVVGASKNHIYTYDAEKRFQVETIQAEESPLCISGQVLQGMKKPDQCQAFGSLCTPDNPLGATMVSDEGACAAYYRYRIQTPDTRENDS